MKHGHRIDGKKTPEYQSYCHAKYRCTCPTNDDYIHYGARGITMDPRWLDSFWNFLSDMGCRPVGTSLDRKDVNGNYEPGNCVWSTTSVQNKNRRRWNRKKVLTP